MSDQKTTAEMVEEIMALDCARYPEWTLADKFAQRQWVTNIIDRTVVASIDLSFCSANRGDDWGCFTSARIAANYAFMIRPDLREPRSWSAPEAMQWRGRIGGRWFPGYEWPSREVQ
jgi:hypothetical protein